uniref:Neurensin-2 n=1 Tax=Lygus hesperus TaxID=30085 RepID=A0A0A9ZJI1_LYGHE
MEEQTRVAMERAIEQDMSALLETQESSTTTTSLSLSVGNGEEAMSRRDCLMATATREASCATMPRVCRGTEKSDYTQQLLTCVVQRARMSVVDGAVAGLALCHFLIAAPKPFVTGTDRVDLLKRLVYLVTVRMAFATVQEVKGFAMCLRVVMEKVLIPYLG